MTKETLSKINSKIKLFKSVMEMEDITKSKISTTTILQKHSLKDKSLTLSTITKKSII
jgi:hypothetical protein